jgi:tetratricopeptide (TPR) repeat protein
MLFREVAMGKAIRWGAAAVLLATALSCCRFPLSQEGRYRREMTCAERISDEKSIEILKKGAFCCEPLPPSVTSLPAARRFYYERALALKPREAAPLLGLGRAMWEEGDYRGGLEAYKKAQGLLERPIYAQIGAFTMLRLLRRFDEGRALAERIREEKGVDGAKVAEYLLGRLEYDAGNFGAAEGHLRAALERAARGGYGLGGTPFSMKDAHLYLALVLQKKGDAEGAYREFLLFHKKMSDPEYQIFYAYWLPRLEKDQGALLEKIETEWAHLRQ